MRNQTLKQDRFYLSYDVLNSMINPVAVINNGFELLKYRFENTMDSYAISEFERIERAIEKLIQRIELLRDEYQVQHTKAKLFK